MSPRSMFSRHKLDHLALAAAAVLALGACSTQPKQYDWELVAPPNRPVPQVAPQPQLPPVVKPSTGGTAEDFITSAGDRVFFDIDKSILKPESQATLNRQAEWLARYPNVTVRVEGNTDITGTPAHNMGLGLRRANTVKDYLIARGVDASRISAISYGQIRPINPGRNVAALAQNRNATTTTVVITGYSR